MKKPFMILLFAAGAVSGAFTFAAYKSAVPGGGVGGEALIPLLLIMLFNVGWYSRDMYEMARQSPRNDIPGSDEDGEPIVMMSADADAAYDDGYYDGWRDANKTFTTGRMSVHPLKKSRTARRKKTAKPERSTQNGEKKNSV